MERQYRGNTLTEFLRDMVRKNSARLAGLEEILDFLYSITIVFDHAGRVALDLPATQYLGAGDASTHNEEYR